MTKVVLRFKQIVRQFFSNISAIEKGRGHSSGAMVNATKTTGSKKKDLSNVKKGDDDANKKVF